MIGYIVGSGFYEHPECTKKIVKTKYGPVELLISNDFVLLPRHGEGHKYLPHHINYRANMVALKSVGCTAIVSFSVCWSLSADIPLGSTILVDDIYYPDNRLPDGSICTIYDTPGDAKRWHLIAGSLCDTGLMQDIKSNIGIEVSYGTYIYSAWPRFNTKSEIRWFQNIWGDIISQTCGPEAVLANELEIPYALVGYAIDYANGVVNVPTSMETLNQNLSNSKKVFTSIIEQITALKTEYSFQNFVYRFGN